jgi:hypothetical protein
MKWNVLPAALVLAGTILTGCAGGAYVVAAGPPPPRYGVMGYAPGAGYVWTEGPPRPGRVWVSSTWVRSGNHWRFHNGYWR